MRLPSLKFSLKPPPPRAVLLPGGQFFTRAVPVTPGASPADAAAEIALALEAMSPFPPAQMYHGHHHRPGAKHALVFAAYRKRFSGDKTESWAGAEVVLPGFAALLGAQVKPATTVILSTAGTMTALHWRDASDAPTAVLTRPLPPDDAGPGAREALRDELLREAGEALHVEEVEITATDDSGSAVIDGSDAGYVFRAGKLASTFTRDELDALDVRDKDEIALRRRDRRRDLLLWRVFLGGLALLAFALLLEAAIAGMGMWEKVRRKIVDAQAQPVAEIDRANALATRVEDISTKRLLPFEMIDIAKAKRPRSVLYTRVTTRSLYSLEIQARTNVPNDLLAYRATLNATPGLASVAIEDQTSRNGITTFRLILEFKPEAVRPAEPEPAGAGGKKEPVPEPGSPEALAAARASRLTPPPGTAPTVSETFRPPAPPAIPGAAAGAPAGGGTPIGNDATPPTANQPNPPPGPPPEGAGAPVQPAPAGPTAMQSVSIGNGSHVVRAGETGAKIAGRNGVGFPDLEAANPGVDWTRLRVGQTVLLPQKSETTE
ncbi:MAG: LysM peptidoglycan-binding domain-containing protein, partial [Opitutaceae bacterium]|nr:LysM peptidoglycan-binding domain-containing protein [Opitutaceae bacterium]